MATLPPPYTIPCDAPAYPNQPYRPPPSAPTAPINPPPPPTNFYPAAPTVVQQPPPAVVPIVMQQQQQAPAASPPGGSGPNIVVNTNVVGGGGGSSGGACRIAAITCPICKIGVIVSRRNPLIFWLIVCLSFALPPISLFLCYFLCTDLVREDACTACRYHSGFHLF